MNHHIDTQIQACTNEETPGSVGYKPWRFKILHGINWVIFSQEQGMEM